MSDFKTQLEKLVNEHFGNDWKNVKIEIQKFTVIPVSITYTVAE
jgi:hypothetical protein